MTTPTYDVLTLKALRESIKHWWENWSGAKPFSTGANCCALCQKFNNESRSNACIGCPVKDTTEQLFCRATPYVDAINSAEARQALSPEAKAELDFLISIYEKATSTKLIYTKAKPPRKANTRTTLSRPKQPKPLLENSSGPSN